MASWAGTVLPALDLDAHELITSSFTLSFLGFVTAFYLFSPYFAPTKQTSWILTAISSATMSLASLPFLWDFLANGGSVQHVRTSLPVFAVWVNRFFQAYLAADLLVGSINYRSRISVLEGWVHHSLYLFIVELCIRRSWAHIFCLCGAMEIPTFVLGISILYPQLRNNAVFAVTFFMTRISLHIYLTIAYLFADNRAHATGGSFVPAMLLTGILPLHVMWFVGCIKGFIKRAKQPAHPPVTTTTTTTSNTNVTISRPSTPSFEPPSRNPSPAPSRLRVRLSHRRQSFEKVFRSLRVDFLESPSLKRLGVSTYIPRRETVFEYVGLGGRDERANEPVPVTVTGVETAL